ncbi:MAG: hypothetical protein LBD29_04040 [Treponema sp.]|jgi:hypothetical protein|nr:hypothetical protein [Treponema sp.]
MGQGILKEYRRALRRTGREEKNNIISSYMAQNWEKIAVSAVALIRQFDFKDRFQIAMAILFKPIKKTKAAAKPKESGAA